MAGNSGGNFWFFVQPVRAWFLPDVRIHSHSITHSIPDTGISLGRLTSICSYSYLRKIYQLQKSQCMVRLDLLLTHHFR
jgi:hypothetical protein